MPKSVGDRYLNHVAAQADLVKELRRAKAKAQSQGEQVIFHKMIKQVKPNYKFFRAHATMVKQFQKVIDGGCTRLIVACPPRQGKLVAHDTPVLTLGGWTKHGNLGPGDWVYHPSGTPVKVLAISVEDIADYRVRIDNGDEIWCHANHEWEVVSPSGELVVMETRDVCRLLTLGKQVKLTEVLWTGEQASFVSISRIPEMGRPGRCIQVDASDGLYLVGKNLTPTHNSELSSRLLPAAYLLAHPDRYVAICSYSAELAETFSREAREYYKAAGGMLDPTNTSVNNWGTAGGGGCWATGIGGSVTGRSANLIIADDTVKGREEADSPKTMEKLWSFYQGSLYTRLEPGHSAIVVVATRWGEADLTGRLLELEANSPPDKRENWTIIDLPAISEDPNSRPPYPDNCEVIPDWREEPGVALCPQRYDIDDLERIRQIVGPREWAALYQQRPAPESGNMFNPNWWQFYESPKELPTMDRVMLSVDCAFTASASSDYVVGTVIGQHGSSYYVLDMARDKLDIGGTIAMMLRMRNKHQLDGIIIELAANGHAVYQTLSSKVPGLIGYKPGDRSKQARLAGIVPVVEAGNVFLPKYEPWLDTFINEFSLFPAAKNDDICDSVAQCINYLNQRSIAQLTEVHWGRSAFLPGQPNSLGGF